LDYGTYVDLLGTSKQPAVDLFEDDGSENVVVPFDDKRSICRIVLNVDILDNAGSNKASGNDVQ
jgi:hypothetical protein